VDGRIVRIENAGSGNAILLTAEDTGSVTTNRFKISLDSEDQFITLNPGDGITLFYSNAWARWLTLASGQRPNRHVLSHMAGGGDEMNAFTGASGVSAGEKGLVPQPAAGEQQKVLQGGGTWVTQSAELDTLASMAQGDVLYRNGTVWTRLAAGTSGQFLQTKGAGANPIWSDLGSLVGIQSLAAGTTTYTPSAGTKRALVWLCGAGGGGGAADWTSGTTFAGGGGGGAGSQSMYRVSAVSGTYTVSIGTGGAAGTVGVSSGTGGTGNNTTFANGATTVTAFGGVGGTQSAAGSAVATALGGGGGAIATNGDFNPGAGDTGQHGVTLSGTVGWSGKGGHCHPFGSGGASRTAQANGIGGVGFGSGGSGGVATSADRTGGAGADGRILIFEFA
jgi:hypothetical protein